MIFLHVSDILKTMRKKMKILLNTNRKALNFFHFYIINWISLTHKVITSIIIIRIIKKGVASYGEWIEPYIVLMMMMLLKLMIKMLIWNLHIIWMSRANHFISWKESSRCGGSFRYRNPIGWINSPSLPSILPPTHIYIRAHTHTLCLPSCPINRLYFK